MNTTAFLTRQANKHRWAGQIGPFAVWEVCYEELPHFTRFVFDVYARTYSRLHGWQPAEEDYCKLLEEDELFYPFSHYWLFKIGKRTVGSVKLTLWNPSLELPLQKYFGIDPATLSKRPIWHCGRLATSWHDDIPLPKQSALPALCFWAVGFVAAHEGVLVAEVDASVLRLLKKLGLNIKELGEAKYIVGSVTVPMMIEHHDLENWVNAQSEHYALR